jgi:hypothetical protein
MEENTFKENLVKVCTLNITKEDKYYSETYYAGPICSNHAK